MPLNKKTKSFRRKHKYTQKETNSTGSTNSHLDE